MTLSYLSIQLNTYNFGVERFPLVSGLLRNLFYDPDELSYLKGTMGKKILRGDMTLHPSLVQRSSELSLLPVELFII